LLNRLYQANKIIFLEGGKSFPDFLLDGTKEKKSVIYRELNGV
jgi:hypothetical protein